MGQHKDKSIRWKEFPLNWPLKFTGYERSKKASAKVNIECTIQRKIRRKKAEQSVDLVVRRRLRRVESLKT